MTEKSQRTPLSEIEKTPEFQRLRKKQKLFVATYIQAGVDTGVYDPVEATLAAYTCQNWAVVRRMSYGLLNNTKIAEVLNFHFSPTPRERFIATLNRAIRNKKLTMAQFRVLQQKAESLGFTQGRWDR